MFSTSFALVVSSSLLLGTESAADVALEVTSSHESLDASLYLRLDGDKCLELGLAPKEVGSAVNRFLKDKDQYKLSDLQNLRVTSRKTGKTYKLKELGEIDVQFTLIRRGKPDHAKDEHGKKEKTGQREKGSELSD